MPVPQILGPDGQPARREILTQEIAAPTLTGVRSVLTGYPTNGLNPARLASIMRDADAGDPMRYLELAEQIEEKDLHYVGVLGTRKRSVAQLEIHVDAASDKPDDVAMADMIRTWLLRDELQDELFDMLDAVGKGFSQTEIIWDTTSGQWQPRMLKWRDPRWFIFDQADGETPLLRTDEGYQPLPYGKFITTRIKAKSGLAIRSGIARIAAWAWMFKAFTQRDWAIFTQTYGQPIRIGKYDPSSSKEDRDILWRAVANIAGDCAAIIPEGMSIEFVSAAVAQTAALYKERSDWLDQQVSKGVLGQTATTDAIAGGHAVGQEHRQVQEDIERADAKALSANLNRDLVKVWIDLEYGPNQKAYPRIRIGNEEDKDVAATVSALGTLVPMGLKVQMSEVRDMLGFGEPEKDAELLVAPAAATPPPAPMPPDLITATQSASTAPSQDAIDTAIASMLADQGWEQLVAPMMGGVAEKLGTATSLDEATQILAAHMAGMDVNAMAELLAQGLFAARLAGEGNQTLIPGAGV